ncbi:MAG: RNA polymerase sigma factor [Actinomycetota bacterium]
MDNDLIARIAGGDDSALRELFDAHAPWLAARLRAALPAGDVEDVLQETFLAVWRSAGGYREQGSAGGWLWVIARRQAAQWLRRHGRDESSIDALAVTQMSATTDPADVAAARTDLAAAVESLGAEGSPEREVWRLLYLEDQPVARVAELMGVPVGTVKSRAHRVRRLIRTALAGRPSAEEGS